LSADQLTLTFDLTKTDLDAIKLIDGLLTVDTDSFLEYSSGFIKDMFGVIAEPILAAKSAPVATFQKDDTDPALVSFEVDMTKEELILSFTEPIRFSTIVPTARVTVRNPPNFADESHVLTGGTPTTNDQLTVTIKMSHDDLAAIKVKETMYKDKEHSAISLAANFATDYAGNEVTTAVKAAAAFRKDDTSPNLTGFAVDMKNGKIQLNFDEPVLASSLTVYDVAGASGILQLQGGSDESVNGVETHTVKTVEWDSTANGPHLTLTIDSDELNEIKKKTALFTKEADTFISFFNGALVTDMAGNAVVNILASAAEQVTANGFVNDDIRPQLNAFSLDMASSPGILVLTFSETVDVSTLSMNLITLQNRFAAPDNDDSGVAPLVNEGIVTTVGDSTEISITLHKDDFDTLKLKRIGQSELTTYLVLGDGAIYDMATGASVPKVNGVSAIAVKSGGLILDDVDPVIENFDINLSEGTIDVFFTEPVDKNTLDASKLRLQGKRKIGN
jgi:hypothetical protein